jgi:hypothetical protein
MQELRPSETSEWWTPPFIFDSLNCQFDLDPCSPGPGHWVPANRVYTIEDDGLVQPWEGLVWMNPPFGGRNGQVPWLKKFMIHGNGIALVSALTSSGWFHDWATKAETLVFPAREDQVHPSRWHGRQVPRIWDCPSWHGGSGEQGSS